MLPLGTFFERARLGVMPSHTQGLPTLASSNAQAVGPHFKKETEGMESDSVASLPQEVKSHNEAASQGYAPGCFNHQPRATRDHLPHLRPDQQVPTMSCCDPCTHGEVRRRPSTNPRHVV
ncbi:hypothetical protein NDU88_002700 [Pleurodeles waltl]|uniref:Uncharacterized protein n=1 Tax=Pleurodeles waltl TaxID=8319 RepID=A0AAV7M2A2_PLEWA|nr:hypothetical protein NDU88_002700 [Pleurodeles waltl]